MRSDGGQARGSCARAAPTLVAALPRRGLVDRRHPRDDGGRRPRASRPTPPSAVRSQVRPVDGHLRPTSTGPPARWPARLQRRGGRAGRRRRVPAPELGRGRHHVLGRRLPRRGRRADRALLRRQGGRLHPRRHRSPTSSSPPTASGTPTTCHLRRRCSADRPGPRGWSSATRRPRRCPRGADRVRRPARRRPDRRPAAGRSRTRRRSSASPRARPRNPKGVVHSHRTIGFETRQLDYMFPHGRPAADHRRAGRALHRDAQRVPRPAARGTARSTSSTCGTRARSCA